MWIVRISQGYTNITFKFQVLEEATQFLCIAVQSLETKEAEIILYYEGKEDNNDD